MAENKTKPTAGSVKEFLDSVDNEQKRKDSYTVLDMLKKASGEEPTMWGTSMIGFGHVRIKSPATGREVDWFRVGFSPRKASITLYLSMDIRKHAATLNRLGKHKTGVGCLYVNKLEDIDMKVLKELVDESLSRKY